MMTRQWRRINGRGNLVLVTVKGETKGTCSACSQVMSGGAAGCILHGVIREDIELCEANKKEVQ